MGGHLKNRYGKSCDNQMKPRLFNYILSHAFWISTGGGTLIAIILITRLYINLDVFNLEAKYIIFAILLYIPSGLVGFVLGAFPGWMIVSNIVRYVQGAPFHVGDTVCVLSGKYKGTITTIYEVWESRGQVRVNLGADAKEKISDVFCDVAVFKQKRSE